MRIAAGILIALLCAAVTPAAMAVPIINPEPAALFEDIDGSGYFNPTGTIFSIEIFDVADFLALTGNTFGFFFANSDASDPVNLIPIFDSDDLIGQEAVVNFGAGIVVDVDQGAVQFAFSGTGSIGFYLTLNAFGGTTLFSDSLLNGGVDYFGALPFLVDSGRFALAFADPDTNDLINLVVLNNAIPVSLPEPSPVLLVILGLSGILLALRRQQRIIQT